MARLLLAALLAASATAAAQTVPEATPPTTPPEQPAQPAPAPAPTVQELEEVKKQLEQRLEEAKQEVRQEMRAQLATQSAAGGWEEEFVEQTRRLELLELDGYFRVRPDMFHKFDLNRPADPAGFRLFPRPPTSESERTVAGANMRLRVDPTINVSEEVRILATIDVLDNVVLGSNPTYANTRSQRFDFGVFEHGQVSPQSALNALQDSILVKRAYGEVSTPVGILRFGRMGAHWGMGMVYNDGNCLDCDFGDSVDRIMFVTEPFTGWYFAPMLEFNAEGPTSQILGERGQAFDLSNTDDNHSLVLAIARRDTEQQRRAKLDNNLGVFNYGVHFSFRQQVREAVGFNDPELEGAPTGFPEGQLPTFYVPRRATLYIPDLWAKYETKDFRLEFEGAAILGNIEARAVNVGDTVANSQELQVVQFGALAQAEYRGLVEGKLRLELEAGFASGDKAPGLGNFPARPSAGRTDAAGNPIEGPQYVCGATGCSDSALRNFRFNPAYRPDMILFREILQGITDAVYLKPRVTYSVAEGFDIFGQGIISSAIYQESTPSGTSPWLGIELNAGAKYETEDGFIAVVQYGILFPQAGLNGPGAEPAALETAQAVRGILGIRY